MFGFKSSVTTPQPAVLVVDIGGSRVKLFSSASRDTASFSSGSHFGPDELMRHVRQQVSHWKDRHRLDWLSRRHRTRGRL